MDSNHPVPWFPAWGVRFPEPVSNIFSTVSIVNEFRPNNRWMLLAFEAAASELHLWSAWYTLRRNEISGEMVAKTADAEFLRLISGTRQINKAFERAGIAIGDERAWIVMLPDSELGIDFGEVSIPVDTYNDSNEDGIKLIEHLRGSLIPERPIPSIEGLRRIESRNGIVSKTMEIEDAFLSHLSLSSLK